MKFRLGFLGAWALLVIGVLLAAAVAGAEWQNWRDVERLRKLIQDAGRDPARIALAYRVHRHGTEVSAKADDGEKHLFSGSAAEIAEDLRAMRGLGVAAVDFSFPAPTADAMLAAMRRFHDEVSAKAQ